MSDGRILPELNTQYYVWCLLSLDSLLSLHFVFPTRTSYFHWYTDMLLPCNSADTIPSDLVSWSQILLYMKTNLVNSVKRWCYEVWNAWLSESLSDSDSEFTDTSTM